MTVPHVSAVRVHVARALRGRGARAKRRAVRWRVDARQGRRGSKCDAVVAAAVDGREGAGGEREAGGGKWSEGTAGASVCSFFHWGGKPVVTIGAPLLRLLVLCWINVPKMAQSTL